ncbi:MAG TPA: hypothetical protein DEO94_06535 [Cyanobacteria bacterium UBA11991]|nr:hypothetical protein [Cyanobacteriota bacterium]MDY6358522.1 hypothetical protein [Cyanobacteriota bacterium]MDY6383653.1 hypothetical protein [Cyanobacteriota bacterium]HCB11770.1 hypothetical protein [Cyanobacteria bacterium UBA11991]
MAVKGFDYEGFAQNLAGQAQDLVPNEFSPDEKQYVINTLGNFAMMAGKALAEDKSLNFDADTCTYITQIIAEWSFHKSVDTIRAGIPRQHWDSVMQRIAYTIFEVAKQAFTQKLPNDQIIELIEHHVNKAYNDALEDLKNKGIIDESLEKFAASQNNMNKMAQEMQQQAAQQAAAQVAGADPNSVPQAAQNLPQAVPASGALAQTEPEPKALKLATVAMLFKRMNQDRVQTMLDKFEDQDAQDVIRYMRLPDLTQRVGVENALRCLQEIKLQLPKASDLAPMLVVKKIKNFASKYTENELETILIKERIGVKRLVFTALEDKYYEKIPPKVASIVATHLQNSV